MTKKLFAVFFALALAALAYAFVSREPGKLTLDNAYVSGRLLKIAASADGALGAYGVKRADRVVKGERLFRIGDGEEAAALDARRQAFLAALGKAPLSCEDLSSPPALLRHPGLQEGLAALRGAFNRAAGSEVLSPSDGYVYEVLVYPGRYVKKGESLLVLVPREEPLIEANVLESEIALISPGAPVTVIPDAGGGKLRLAGEVRSVVPAVAAAFSPLPRNNLDSNWIKTTQRVPVLISLASPQQAAELPLGSSVKVVVELGAAKPPKASPSVSSAEQMPADRFDEYLRLLLREHRDKAGRCR